MQQSTRFVSDVMRSGVVSVAETTSLADVARVMREHGVHAVLVVGEGGHMLGWVTAHGMLSQRADDWRRVVAGDAISEPCARIVPSASVHDAIDAMLDAKVTHLWSCGLAATPPKGSCPTSTWSRILRRDRPLALA
jgi:CBS domain-containing protein